jgi:acetoacetyl-CoA synthetase
VTAHRPALWEPSADRAAAANVSRFLAWLEQHRGVAFDGYASLWRWSVDALEDFWSAVWGFHGVRSETPFEQVLADR